MTPKKWVCFLVTVFLIWSTAGLILQARVHQKLGVPGLKTQVIPGSIRLQADLPERSLDYTSEEVPLEDDVLKYLPADTSFGQRNYRAPDGFQVAVRVVLMGTDRTSLHKPQMCLPAQGWHIDDSRSVETTIPVQQPVIYDLPVVKLIANRELPLGGETTKVSGIYVYWFVCDDGVSASITGFERMWSMAKKLLRTGVLQRWAYVSCWSTCLPGQEEATFERMKKFIASTVPQFQLVPKPSAGTLAARQ
jgi:hypothetical protein